MVLQFIRHNLLRSTVDIICDEWQMISTHKPHKLTSTRASKLFQSCKHWNSLDYYEYNVSIILPYFSPLIYPFFCLFREISDNKD